MHLPQNIIDILSRLTTAGFSAYAVGGCVRDSLLDKEPHDWDVCTNARPEQVQRLFDHTVPIGIAHGTVAVLTSNNMPVEVTTFRDDRLYIDGRHPAQVLFLEDVAGDLSRRDFTVNAMAYHPKEGLKDLFGGKTDLENGVLRAVGVPEKRFAEDRLRILRGLRFASQLDFVLEEETAAALHSQAKHLTELPAERILPELDKLLTGKGAARILREYQEIVGVVLPEILPMKGFLQHTKYHHLDVWEHTLMSLEQLKLWERTQFTPEEKTEIAWAVLLHDCGKPPVFFQDENGVGHFYGHPRISERYTREIAHRLRFSSKRSEQTALLVRYHDGDVQPTDKSLNRWLNRLGEPLLRALLTVKEADALSHAPEYAAQRLEGVQMLREALEELLLREPCFHRGMMALKGEDLLSLGVSPGPLMGELLDKLLSLVMEGVVPNEKAALTRQAERLLSERSHKPSSER